MSFTNADLERQFYLAAAGLTDAQAASMTNAQLRAAFIAGGGIGSAANATYEPLLTFHVNNYATPQAALNAAAVAGGVMMYPKGVAVPTAALSLPPNLVKKVIIRGAGRGVTTIQLSSGCPQFTTLGKVADGDTFKNIAIEDLTVDGGNVANASHAVFGNYTAGACQLSGYRTNFDNITFRRIEVVNLYNDPTGAINRPAFSLSPYAPVADAVTYTLKNVLVEDVTVAGGNTGFTFNPIGNGSTGDTFSPYYSDNINFVRCRHDVGSVPTQTTVSNSFFVGGRGTGGRASFRDCYSRGCGDTAFEADGMDAVEFDNCQSDDAWNYGFLFTNFQASANPFLQKVAYRNCTAKALSTPSTTWVGFGTKDNGYDLGEVAWEDAQAIDTRASVWSTSLFQAYGPLLRVRVDGCRAVFSGKTYSGGSALYVEGITFRTTTNSAGPTVADVRDCSTRYLSCVRSGAGAVSPHGLTLNGASLAVDVQHVTTEFGWTGLGAGSVIGLLIGDRTSSIRGKVRAFKITRVTGDAAPVAYWLGTSTTLTITDTIRLSEFDYSQITGATTTVPVSVVAKVTLDSSATAPAIPVFMRSGFYYGSPGGSLGTAAPTAGSLTVTPIYVPKAITISALRCEVTTAGSAGSLARLCIYSDDGNGYPGALLLDAGVTSSDASTTGIKSVTGLSQAITAGTTLWLGLVTQGAPATTPTYRSNGAVATMLGTQSTTSMFVGGYNYSGAAASGAPPGTFTSAATAGYSGSGPRVELLVA